MYYIVLMHHLFLLTEEMDPGLKTFFLALFFIGMFLVVFSQVFIFIEQQYAERFYRPLFFWPLWTSKRPDTDAVRILENQFPFYKKLSQAHKRRFGHRLVTLRRDLKFEGRENLVITEEMTTLITATAVMMTFGFRNYRLPNLEKVIMYPGTYLSELGQRLHKGEYSPVSKAVIFSWEDLLKGFEINNDNINLALHEFSHVIHLRCHFGADISSLIYNQGFKALKKYLKDRKEIRTKLMNSDYIRSYAFDNEVEFVAVLLECFFETPIKLNTEFPEIFMILKRMLNLNSWT